MSEVKKIGILTSGGDCSGLNSVIRNVVFAANSRGWEVVGIFDATDGLFSRPMRYRELRMADFDFPYASLGGTMLGTNNTGNPHIQKKADGTTEELTDEELNERFKSGVQELGISALIVVGGDGSMAIVSKYCKMAGISMIGIPKTIDNDAPGTDMAIGFSTAVGVVTNALDNLTTTATSHNRIMIAEVMGRGAGHLALEAGVAGFADVILIPEIKYTYEGIVNKLKDIQAKGKRFGLVVIAEGVKTPDGKHVFAANGKTFQGVSQYFVERLQGEGFNVRANVLGHIQRAGVPVPADRLLAAQFATRAIDLIEAGEDNRVVVYQDGHVEDMDLNLVLKIANTPVNPMSDLVLSAKALGIYVGEAE